ncbi:MAG: hypothetical protein SWH61_10750 [Thermodesulfobacteriota bacterium]|nr:hypothetical protein [Thermodesulfobacteriota bacterium]
MAVLVLVLVIAGGTGIRIQATFSSPNFDPHRPEGQLMSDPALLFYLTERIIAGGGLPPVDFRSDRRVAYPLPSDLPAMFTVGQEFYLAWGYLLFGKNLPLHVYCVIAMGLFASLAVIGVFGLTRELTQSDGWAAFAGAVFMLTVANYRTIGFILVREDFSLPVFSVHLWLMLRAMRIRSGKAYALAGIALVAAVATWHAMVFVAALEIAAIVGWYLRTGENPLSAPGAWTLPALLMTGGLLIPVLRAKFFLLSWPMLLVIALLLMAHIERYNRLKPYMRLTAVAITGLTIFGITCFFSNDYSHVANFMWNKVIHLGLLPEDPNRLSFGARLLWQGPFMTLWPPDIFWQLGATGIFLAAGLVWAGKSWWQGRGDHRIQILLIFAAMATVCSLLVQRLMVLDGLLVPVITALLLSRIPQLWTWPWSRVLGGALLCLQIPVLALMLPVMADTTWYPDSESRNLARFIDWTRTNLDDKGAIAADYVNSSAILAHTGHPVVLQPKYETLSSRQRIEQFLTTFYHGSPEAFYGLLEEWDCRYLLVDGRTMSALRYQAGLPFSAVPEAGTAAWSFLSRQAAIYTSVPFFRLIYTSRGMPPTWRLYRLDPLQQPGKGPTDSEH